MLTPEDISAVVEAFLATDAGQFLVQEMQTKQGANAIVEPAQEPPAEPPEPAGAPGAEPPAAPGGEPGGEPPAADPGEPAGELAPPPEGGEPAPKPKQPAELPAAHAEPDGDEGAEKAKKYAAACKYADGMNDEDMEKYLSKRWANHPKWKKYAAATVAGEPDKTAAGDVVQETGDPQGSGAPPRPELKPTQLYSRLASEVQDLRGQLTQEQTARKRLERYSRLQGLSAEFIMHPEDEMALTADMNDVQFQRHVERTIKEHYQRNPVGLPWAAPPDSMSTQRDPSHPGNAPVSKETSEKQAAAATERYMRRRHAGQTVEFAEVLEEVKAGR